MHTHTRGHTYASFNRTNVSVACNPKPHVAARSNAPMAPATRLRTSKSMYAHTYTHEQPRSTNYKSEFLYALAYTVGLFQSLRRVIEAVLFVCSLHHYCYGCWCPVLHTSVRLNVCTVQEVPHCQARRVSLLRSWVNCVRIQGKH